MSVKKYTLYIDDSGVRYPQHKNTDRRDGMDWFGWGGILVDKSKEEEIVILYKEFCRKWNITYPLHSTEIRARRGKFSWLETSKKQNDFYVDLNTLLTSIEVIGFGVVISRLGYNKRFIEKFGHDRWELCKTAHPILTERVVRYLLDMGEEFKLKIIFEGSSPKDNKKVLVYAQSLKDDGHPFNKSSSDKYSPLSSEIYRNVISGKPKPGTKSNIFLQIADLYVYPMVKFRYNPSYLPWQELYKSNRIIDSLLKPEQVYQSGIKYYCFVTE